jgi:integrase
MNCFHAFMVFAWRSERIPEVPPFPEKSEYGLVQPIIKWVPEDRQMKIINAIPEEHRPIFLWLKYHLRRPSEACALRKEDYDPFNEVFIIRRTLSARQLVESTKTNTANMDSVKRYGKIEIDRKRHLLETRRTGPKLVRRKKYQ